jgi:parallel beta-helix repeat protein
VSAAKNSYGVYLQNAHNNTVINNNCSRNWVGICLQDSHNNVVEGNILSTNEKGVSLYQADYNLLIGNTIFSNYYGIRFSESHFNEIYHNNLMQNHEQGSLYFSHQNRWNNTLEGNFWSDFDSVDYNRDGLCDTSYVISSSNQDHHPLSGPFTSFIIDDEDTQRIEIITNSTILSFTYNASNESATMTINGTDQTCGFCRVRIPHDLIAPDLSVTIDSSQTTILYSNYSLYDDGLDRWVYVEYSHSVHTIVIVSEFVIPFILIALMSTFLFATIVRKKL